MPARQGPTAGEGASLAPIKLDFSFPLSYFDCVPYETKVLVYPNQMASISFEIRVSGDGSWIMNHNTQGQLLVN